MIMFMDVVVNLLIFKLYQLSLHIFYTKNASFKDASFIIATPAGQPVKASTLFFTLFILCTFCTAQPYTESRFSVSNLSDSSA